MKMFDLEGKIILVGDRVVVVKIDENDEVFDVGAEGVVVEICCDETILVEFDKGNFDRSGDNCWYVDGTIINKIN